MTLFDFIAIFILLISGVVGFVRGAIREVSTVLAFIFAVMVAVLGLRFTGPFARQAIHPEFVANAAAILVSFIVVYILFRFIGSQLTKGVHSAQALGLIDRVVGVGFGLVRAAVLLGVFYLLFNLATPPERVPHWIKDAAFYPLSSASGHMLMALAPQGSVVASKVGPALENAIKEGSSDKVRSPPTRRGEGYDAESRKGVDELVEKNR